MDLAAAAYRLTAPVWQPVGSLAGLALPQACGGCRTLGTPWCCDCAHEVARETSLARIVSGRAGTACGPGGVVLAAAPYAGPLRSAVVAFKDGGRRDLLSVLAPVMRAVLVEALTRRADDGAPIAVVPAPSSTRSRRTRGDVPLHLLVRRALDGADVLTGRTVLWAPVLHAGRVVADQSRLSRQDRRTNVQGAFVVGAPYVDSVKGLDVVVADDVVTTGATARECVRALREAGARPIAVAALAATLRTER